MQYIYQRLIHITTSKTDDHTKNYHNTHIAQKHLPDSNHARLKSSK